MKESFDAELGRAFKQSAAKALDGLEFTPAMQQNVLKRIAADSAHPVRDRRFPSSQRLLGPFAMVAVAAAAVVLLVNTDLSGFGFGNQGDMGTMESAPMAAEPAGKAADRAMTLAPPPSEERAESPEIAGASVAGLTVLEVPVAMVARAIPDEPPILMAVAPVSLTLTSTGVDGAMTLSAAGVKAVDSAAETRWERSLEGLSGESVLAVSATQYTAVTAQKLIYLIDPQGAIAQTLYLPDPVSSLAWSSDGRLAVAHGSTVSIYRDGSLLATVAGGTDPDLAFGSDGALAVYSASVSQLGLYDSAVNLVLKVASTSGRTGLALAEDGAVILAGGQAFDHSGHMRWQAPVEADGVLLMPGTNLALFWTEGTLAAVHTDDGSEVWRAVWPQLSGTRARVVSSADGRYLAVMARVEEGPVVWVLNREGTEVFQELIGGAQADVGFVGDRLILLRPETVQTRELPR